MTPDLGAATWRKSSYSNLDGGQCVLVADNLPGIVPVRDSKNPEGPVLIFQNDAWSTFIAGLKKKAEM
ncbi:DUF397 domain-containing protein [Streptomyces malaysiensis subsp. malaysiensis]|uniref:DUF397 domain-containing protein n=1 Tax=Streptomyces autolyticus TaxID=75293 RepID=A0ABN4WK78_9ACTN|nr:DUF397 domain-containing protein [Streptomyces autolyticus]